MKILGNKNEKLEQLKADCEQCSGLCCTALFFSKMDGFPKNKAAGEPCINLQKNFRCKIHQELEERQLKGCIGYDCFGAGQHVTQHIYQGKTWQTLKEQQKEIFDVFVIMTQLYQIRYYLEESKTILPAKALWSDIEGLIKENEDLTHSTVQRILDIDMESYRKKVNVILKKVCVSLKDCFKNKENNRVTEYMGKNCSHMDMRGLDVSMRLLIAANFEGCTCKGTIFLGADTRDANFINGDLREVVFLTQGQINSAKGNRNTKLPSHLDYPVTWK